MKQEEKSKQRLTSLDISTKSLLEKGYQLQDLHDQKQVHEDDMKTSNATLVKFTTQETQLMPPCFE
jgi:hypothetical protein